MAQAALRRKRPLTASACFHAQQCAEKYLKAILVAQGHLFPRTHDLLALHTLCVQVGVISGIPLDRLESLSAYAVQVRYPGEDPTPEETKEALDAARVVRRFVRKLLGVH
ncbi:MAG: HEPN domain-containing protein [Chloroflexi bacterium]|nr:MAG: HEPN domain-containing protein [Chloroflexota bacterium]